MRILKLLCLYIGIAGISDVFAMEKPLKNFQSIFLNKIENKTGKTLKIFLEGETELISKDFPKKIQLSPRGPGLKYYSVRIDIEDPNDKSFNPFITIEKQDDSTIRSILFYRTSAPVFSSTEITHTDTRINAPEESFYISLILEGDKLEKSKIQVMKKYQPKTLHKQSIEAVAQKVKNKELTLEQAKKKLPLDLHEELESVVKRSAFRMSL